MRPSRDLLSPVGGAILFALGAGLFAYLLAMGEGCATLPEIVAEQPLIDQRLSFRPDHPGKMTYLVCLTKSPETGVCTEEVIHEVDLKDAGKRSQLDDMGFVCNVAGERYKVCFHAPGLCQITQAKTCGGPFNLFCTSKEIVAKYLDGSDDLQKLIDANARCFQKDRYPFDPTG